MHTSRITGQRHIHTIINDQRHIVTICDLLHLKSLIQILPSTLILLAKLDQSHTTLTSLLNRTEQRLLRMIRTIRHQIQRYIQIFSIHPNPLFFSTFQSSTDPAAVDPKAHRSHPADLPESFPDRGKSSPLPRRRYP